MGLIDTVVEVDDRPYFTFRHGEHLLVPAIYTYIYLRVFKHSNTKKSFNTEKPKSHFNNGNIIFSYFYARFYFWAWDKYIFY